jgi:hypothetical protein
MTGIIRGVGLSVAVWLLAAGAALAQENLNAGKTPAELYASDCAICHKSPQGLASKAGIFGLENFLREHYTSSRESAAKISAYVESIDREPTHQNARSRPSKAARHKAKLALPPPRPSAANSSAKPPEGKTSAPKSAKTKPEEHKASESKPAAGKSSSLAHEEVKASAAKKTRKAKSQAKPDGSKTETSKTDSKPAPDKPEKSD